MSGRSLASAPRLASRSAFLFFSRGTWRIVKRRNAFARRIASETRGFRCSALTRKFPLTCSTRSRLSDGELDLVGAELARARQREQQRAVLGDVVRLDPERLEELLGGAIAVRLDVHARAGGTGIAARGAVDGGSENHWLSAVSLQLAARSSRLSAHDDCWS